MFIPALLKSFKFAVLIKPNIIYKWYENTIINFQNMRTKVKKPLADHFILSPDECSLIIWYSFKFILVYVLPFFLILFVQDVLMRNLIEEFHWKNSDARVHSPWYAKHQVRFGNESLQQLGLSWLLRVNNQFKIKGSPQKKKSGKFL